MTLWCGGCGRPFCEICEAYGAGLEVGRRQGLEDAARLVNEWGEGYFSRDKGEELAAAIRALANKDEK